MKIAVVVSCYRQESFLARTAASIEAALAGEDWEGVLELAVRSDAPLPALPPPWRVVTSWDPVARRPGRMLTPGAGRMAGFDACGGEWVLFVDSDCEIDAGWMRRALDTAAREPSLAGLTGRIEEWFEQGGRTWMNKADMYGAGDTDRPVTYLVSLALYRRDALRAVGGYDPRMNSDEDFELGLRLVQRGFALRSLGQLGARHWSPPRPTLRELGRRWTTGICFGQGQGMRLYLGRPGLGPLVLRQRFYIGAVGLWALGFAALAAAIATGDALWLAAWAALPLLVIAVMTVRKRSVRLAVLSLLTWTLNGVGMLVGFFKVPPGARPWAAAEGRFFTTAPPTTISTRRASAAPSARSACSAASRAATTCACCAWCRTARGAHAKRRRTG